MITKISVANPLCSTFKNTEDAITSLNNDAAWAQKASLLLCYIKSTPHVPIKEAVKIHFGEDFYSVRNITKKTRVHRVAGGLYIHEQDN